VPDNVVLIFNYLHLDGLNERRRIRVVVAGFLVAGTMPNSKQRPASVGIFLVSFERALK
jgi:hypothetical protein